MSSLSSANSGWMLIGVIAVIILGLTVGAALAVQALLRWRAGIARLSGTTGPVAALSPTEIMAALDAVPLLMRPKAAKAYREMPVCRVVTFEAAIPGFGVRLANIAIHSFGACRSTRRSGSVAASKKLTSMTFI